LEQWIHSRDTLPPLIKAGLAHVQFETIHPFLDGNGRIGRLLVTLLIEHWGLLNSPLLYLSLALKQRRTEYYQRLSAVRAKGDWEGWTVFFLECVRAAADDGVRTAGALFALLSRDRRKVTCHPTATVPAIRLFDLLAENPMITVAAATRLLQTTKPTAIKAIDALCGAGVVHEITGRRRDRVYAYQAYLTLLAQNTQVEASPPVREMKRSRSATGVKGKRQPDGS
jgi:Fic family protein